MNEVDKAAFETWVKTLTEALNSEDPSKSFLVRAKSKKEAIEELNRMITQAKNLMEKENENRNDEL
jgi:hypothetical protein